MNSNPTGIVAAATTTSSTAPVNTGLPTISGTRQGGAAAQRRCRLLVGEPDELHLPVASRCDASGNGCATVVGAHRGNSYLLGSGDLGRTRFGSTSSRATRPGTGSMNSNPTAIVAAATVPTAPVNTSLPTISGTARVGQSLSASVGTWSNSPTSYTFQCRCCDASGNGCATVVGATANSYLLGSGDLGRTIRVNVFASNAAGTGSMNSNPTAIVAAATRVTAPVNTSLPTISGTAKVGQRLSAGVGSWSGSPTSYTYQWRRCNTSGNDSCHRRRGCPRAATSWATATVANTIRVNVFATNAAGTTWMNSNPTATVAGIAGFIPVVYPPNHQRF